MWNQFNGLICILFPPETSTDKPPGGASALVLLSFDQRIGPIRDICNAMVEKNVNMILFSFFFLYIYIYIACCSTDRLYQTASLSTLVETSLL